MNEIVIAIITGLVGLFSGGGGIFAYINHKQKTKQDAHDSAVSEWKELYDEMKRRLDAQEDENQKLKDEIFELRQSITSLNIELQNYKKYDTYINNLEKYIDNLLHVCEGTFSEDAYKNIKAKRPQRVVVK